MDHHHHHPERRGSLSTTIVIQEGSTSGPFSTPALSISIDESDDDPSSTLATTPISVDDCMNLKSRGALEAYQSFDMVVGAIEDVAVGSEFQNLQSFYLSKYWKEFGDNEEDESSHEQFVIFQNYSREMAHLIETHVKRQFGNDFSFSSFIERWYGTLEEGGQGQGQGQQQGSSSISNSREKRNDECSAKESNSERPDFHMTCEIETLLFTLTDFCKFKELMIDYRKMLEGKTPTLSVTHQRLDFPH